MAFFRPDTVNGSSSSLQLYGFEMALAWFWGQNPEAAPASTELPKE